MLRTFLFYFLTLLYMETVYHIGCLGLAPANPLIAIPLCTAFAGLAALFTGLFHRKGNRAVFFILLSLAYLLFAFQLVYMRIFKQPLLLAAVTNGGKDALTNYWREAFTGIVHASGLLLALAVPFAIAGILLRKRRSKDERFLPLEHHHKREYLLNAGITVIGLCSYVLICVIGFYAHTDYYENYSEFYNPHGVVSTYGVMPSVVRDLCGGIFPETEDSLESWVSLPDQTSTESSSEHSDITAVDEAAHSTDGGSVIAGNPASSAKPGTNPSVDADATGTHTSGGDPVSVGSSSETYTDEPEPLDTSPNVLPIDFERLTAEAGSEEIIKLAEYLQSMPATNRNEYTGMFRGYNLIYLTAEGFSPYAVDETLTPTLYKLIHSGFVFEQYYVPLWSTSTSDGEYTNLTGLIPDQQFSMRRSSEIAMPFALPSFFSLEGAHSYAYHNNTLDYYKRHLSHPNLGYKWQASSLGNLEESVWGGQIFEMENANYWPASDLDMMKATIPQYIGEDRFHVYYMTVSGHMNYSFSGNMMSSLHREEVAGLPYSGEGRAYIACNIELDRALEYLIKELDAAGRLSDTVICLSADHYPYGMEINHLEELAGKPLRNTLDIYRNHLILWNSEMDTVIVDKPACSQDVLPTLLNLFGFSYDSRLYAGRDILSDSAPLVIFSDRSFITDRVAYHKSTGQTDWSDASAPDEEYLEVIKKQVRSLYSYTAGILNNDFYRYVLDALPESYHPCIDPDWTAPHPAEDTSAVSPPENINTSRSF